METCLLRSFLYLSFTRHLISVDRSMFLHGVPIFGLLCSEDGSTRRLVTFNTEGLIHGSVACILADGSRVVESYVDGVSIESKSGLFLHSSVGVP